MVQGQSDCSLALQYAKTRDDEVTLTGDGDGGLLCSSIGGVLVDKSGRALLCCQHGCSHSIFRKKKAYRAVELVVSGDNGDSRDGGLDVLDTGVRLDGNGTNEGKGGSGELHVAKRRTL